MLDALSIVVYVCETMHFSDEATKPDAAPTKPNTVIKETVSSWRPWVLPTAESKKIKETWMKSPESDHGFKTIGVEVKKAIKDETSISQKVRARIAASVDCLSKHVSIATHNKKQDCWTITKSATRKYAGLIYKKRLLVVKTEDVFLIDSETASLRPNVNDDADETMRVHRGRVEIKLSRNLDISDIAVD
jgi:hypothetical protein